MYYKTDIVDNRMTLTNSQTVIKAFCFFTNLIQKPDLFFIKN